MPTSLSAAIFATVASVSVTKGLSVSSSFSLQGSKPLLRTVCRLVHKAVVPDCRTLTLTAMLSNRQVVLFSADVRDITVGALESKFYRLLLEKLGLEDDPHFANQNKVSQWPEQKQQLAALFATRTRGVWCALLEGSDACFAPLLAPSEAARHPHISTRGTYSVEDGLLRAHPAPRFSNSPAAAGGRFRKLASIRSKY